MYISYKSIHNNELSVLVPNVSMIIEQSEAIEIVGNKPLDIIINDKVSESRVEATELSFSKRHQRHLDMTKTKHETPPSLKKLRQNNFIRPNLKKTMKCKIVSGSPSKETPKKPELIRIFELMASKNDYVKKTASKAENIDLKTVVSGGKIGDFKVEISDEIGHFSKRKSAQKPRKLAQNKAEFERGVNPSSTCKNSSLELRLKPAQIASKSAKKSAVKKCNTGSTSVVSVPNLQNEKFSKGQVAHRKSVKEMKKELELRNMKPITSFFKVEDRNLHLNSNGKSNSEDSSSN